MMLLLEIHWMIKWTVKKFEGQTLKEFLKAQGVSRRVIGRVKFHGGDFYVNGRQSRVSYPVKTGDEIILELPKELPNEHLYTSYEPIDILYEDDWFLVVNKPDNLISVPSPAHRGETMASRIKGYFISQDYRHQIVHTVTRLDRHTTGAMLFGKHMLAHSYMDQALREGTLKKEYFAFVVGEVTEDHGLIEAPIARSTESIIERRVHESGKDALTEYWVLERFGEKGTALKILLHTGRTHQIRVHFSHLGHPLMGDDLYGGHTKWIRRQALHCRKLSFYHPLTQEKITVEAGLPNDLKSLGKALRGDDFWLDD